MSWSRYLATVRRAISNAAADERIRELASSESGLVLSSRVHDLLEHDLDGVPGDLFTRVGLRAAGEEAAERDDAARREEVLVRNSALTVATWMPSCSATCLMGSGRRACGP